MSITVSDPWYVSAQLTFITSVYMYCENTHLTNEETGMLNDLTRFSQPTSSRVRGVLLGVSFSFHSIHHLHLLVISPTCNMVDDIWQCHVLGLLNHEDFYCNKFISLLYFMSMSVCLDKWLCTTHVLVLTKVRRGHHIHWNWSDRRLWLATWGLKVSPETSARAASALQYCVIFPGY